MKILLIIKDVFKRYIEEIAMMFVATMVPFASYITVLTVFTGENVETAQLFRYAMDTNTLFGAPFNWFMIALMLLIIKPGLRMIYYPIFLGFILFRTELTTPYHVFSILTSFSVISSVFYQLFDIFYEKIKEKAEIDEEDIEEIKEFVLKDVGDTFKEKFDDYEIIVRVEKEV